MRLYEQMTQTHFDSWNLLADLGNPRPPVQFNVNHILPQCQRYQIDNIAEYYWQTSGTSGEWDLEDVFTFPSFLAPSQRCWFEYQMPTEIMQPTGLEKDKGLKGLRYGALSMLFDRAVTPMDFLDLKPSARYVLVLRIYSAYEKNKRVDGGYCNMFYAAVEEDGSLGRTRDGNYFYNVKTHIPSEATADERDAAIYATEHHAKPFLLAIGFLAASNIIVIDQEFRSKLKEKQKNTPQHKRKGKKYQYQVINIYPNRDKIRTKPTKSGAADKGDSASKKEPRYFTPHFRHYGPRFGKRKLFGNFEGILYMVPSVDKPKQAAKAKNVRLD